MAQFQAFSPQVKVNGQTVLSVNKGMGAFKDSAHRFCNATAFLLIPSLWVGIRNRHG